MRWPAVANEVVPCLTPPGADLDISSSPERRPTVDETSGIAYRLPVERTLTPLFQDAVSVWKIFLDTRRAGNVSLDIPTH
jgi:hypothetical protein